MTLSDVLTLALALMLTYTMLSLLASTIRERIAAWFSRRPDDLAKAIRGLIAPVGQAKDKDGLLSLADQLYGHALVSGTSPNGKPSYVPARNFTLALLDVLEKGSQASSIASVQKAIADLPEGSQIKQSLSALAKDAGNNIDNLKTSIDNLYIQTMDRLNGEFKRSSQRSLLIIGTITAVILNVDTFNIAGTLMADAQLRNAIAAQAEAVAKGHLPDETASIKEQLDNLNALHLPIGWNFCAGAPSGATKDTTKDLAPQPVKPTPGKEAASQKADATVLAAPGGAQDVVSPKADANTPAAPAPIKEVGSQKANSIQSNCIQVPSWANIGDKSWWHAQYEDLSWALVVTVLASLLLKVLGWVFTGIAISFGAPFWFDLLNQVVNMRAAGPKPDDTQKAAAKS